MSGDKPMKSGKLLLIMSIIGLLFVGALNSVVADDEEHIIQDEQGDVLAMDLTSDEYNTTNEKPNVDIKQLTYSKTDGSSEATLILEVYGTIEDRGSLDEDSLDMLNSVIYSINLETSEDTYSFTYVNKQCQMTYGGSVDIVNITDYTKSGGVLTIHFDLTTSTETYVDVSAETLDFTFDISGESGGMYADMAPNEENLSADIYGPVEGEVGENLEFEGEAYDYFGIPGTYSYHWDFGDGTTSTLQNPTHSYSAEGNYEITLTVTDQENNKVNATHDVTISSGESSNGSTNGNGNEDEGNAGLLLFVAIIVIIALVGIAAVVYIIRR
jgi:hypothetical protein